MPSPSGYIDALAELSLQGEPFVAISLVEAIGSTPQDIGAKMLVDASGLVFGTVGGGRIEQKAIGFAQTMLQSDHSTICELVEWNLQRDVGMTCGGTVKLFFEGFNIRQWRIVIFGAGHVVQSVARVLLELECHVVCVDPREEWLAKLPKSTKVTAVHELEMPDYVSSLRETDYVLCITMGHRTDLPILQEVFRQNRQLPYLGVIGSRAKRKVLERELLEAGISSEKLALMHCPMGLPLGSNQPGEIAVSIAAEIITVHDRQRAGKIDSCEQ